MRWCFVLNCWPWHQIVYTRSAWCSNPADLKRVRNDALVVCPWCSKDSWWEWDPHVLGHWVAATNAFLWRTSLHFLSCCDDVLERWWPAVLHETRVTLQVLFLGWLTIKDIAFLQASFRNNQQWETFAGTSSSLQCSDAESCDEDLVASIRVFGGVQSTLISSSSIRMFSQSADLMVNQHGQC